MRLSALRVQLARTTIRFLAVFLGAFVALTNVAMSAVSFDGHWIGEAPYANECGVWKFYLDIRDNSISGYVVGLVNGVSASATIRQSTVNADGIANVSWGRYQGAFRFSVNQMTGNFVGACGQSTMAGIRGPAKESTPTNPQSRYDGDYRGTMVLARDSTIRNQCTQGPFTKTLVISQGKWTFSFNLNQDTKLSGNVTEDGTVLGAGTSFYGGLQLRAKVQGSDLVGEVSSSGCAYTLGLRKLM